MWNDGISKELSDFFKGVDGLDEQAMGAFRGAIDDEVKSYDNRIQSSVPVRTGGLRSSFKVEKETSRRNWYGYRAEFEGEAPNGEPYQKIANVLNYGKPADDNGGAIAGTFFVTKAIRKLQGMDERIEARIEAELIKRT